MNDERSLVKAMQKLDNNQIKFTEFIESDRNNEITALATEPISCVEKRFLFKNYTLLHGGTK